MIELGRIPVCPAGFAWRERERERERGGGEGGREREVTAREREKKREVEKERQGDRESGVEKRKMERVERGKITNTWRDNQGHTTPWIIIAQWSMSGSKQNQVLLYSFVLKPCHKLKI